MTHVRAIHVHLKGIHLKVKKLVPLAAAAAALILGSTAMPASAQVATPTQQKVDDATYQELVAHLAEDGVPATQQKTLANKVLTGKVLDSAKGVKASETKTWSDDTYTYTKDIYPDGSYQVVKMQKAGTKAKSDIVGPTVGGTISGCISTTGSGYVSRRDCSVVASEATYRASFVADYTHSPTVGTIGAVRYPNVKGYGGVASGAALAIPRPRSDGRLAAQAYLRWNFTGANGMAGGTTYLFLNVTPTTASAFTD